MKQILTIFLNLFTWYPGSKWVNRIGLAFLACAALAALFSAPALADKLLKLAFIVLFIFQYLGIPGHYRSLLANRRLGLVPGFHLKAGLAVLLFTMILSCFYQASTLLLGLDTLAPGTALFFFLIASSHMAYMQLTMASKYAHFYGLAYAFALTYILFVIVTRTGFGFVDTYAGMILFCALLAIAGWCGSLFYVATHDHFNPPRSIFMPDPDKEGFRSLWENRERHPRTSTTSGTLLLGFPDDLAAQLKGGFMWIIVFPGAMALFFILMNVVVPGDHMPPFAWTFLAASGFLGGCSTMANGEFAARSRLLWLRYGSNRNMLWRHMEKVLLRNWCCVYANALLVAALFTLLLPFPAVYILNYLLFIPACAFYLLYLSMAGRVTTWPGILRTALYLGSIGLALWAVIMGVKDGQFFILNAVEGGMVVLGLLFRAFARSRFLNIDWYQVRPFSLAAIQGFK